jgi:hypothetical protein
LAFVAVSVQRNNVLSILSRLHGNSTREFSYDNVAELFHSAASVHMAMVEED